ncbi:MAG: hypothetical protein KJO69_00165 [Gammaproteobacteria bacterium]|nr:hypothetical protein [Gammaproteobacteria bacterium]
MSELDRPLNFHGDSEIKSDHFMPGCTPTIGVSDHVRKAAYQATSVGDMSSLAIGVTVGKAASQRAGTIKKELHHEQEYRPCRVLTAEEYERLKRG